jgi:hypothetical protein
MKFTVFIKGPHTIVPLQNSVITSNYNSVFVKRVAVFWEYFNIKERTTLITVKTDDGSVEVAVYPGYYTFNDMKEKLEKKWGYINVPPSERQDLDRDVKTQNHNQKKTVRDAWIEKVW